KWYQILGLLPKPHSWRQQCLGWAPASRSATCLLLAHAPSSWLPSQPSLLQAPRGQELSSRTDAYQPLYPSTHTTSAYFRRYRLGNKARHTGLGTTRFKQLLF